MIRVEATLEHGGERRVYRTEYDFAPDEEGLRAATYHWFEGNYSCDCNRMDFWYRAGGEQEAADSPCGEERVRLVRLLVNGAEVKDYTR